MSDDCLINFNSLRESIDRFKEASEWAYLFTDGDENTEFATTSGLKKSFAKLQQEWSDALDAALLNPVMQVLEITADLTVDETHQNTFIRVNSADDITITLTQNATLSQSFFCMFTKIGEGDVTFVADTGVTIDSEYFKIWSKFTAIACHYVDTDRYQIYGDLF